MHSFHILDSSPWPFSISFSLICLLLRFSLYLHVGVIDIVFYLNSILFVMNFLNWLYDVHVEGSYCGDHSVDILINLSYGFIMFIVSEAFLFLSFFWSFFHLSFVSDIELGGVWPPVGLRLLDFSGLPLLNTVILLTSGGILTFSHYRFLNNDLSVSLFFLFFTIVLGLYFVLVQFFEYSMSSFNISDSVCGSLFFFITGFHGLHVIVGVGFLFFCFIRMWGSFLSCRHHKIFDYSSWYWHFVDVIWLFLYIFIYVWSY